MKPMRLLIFVLVLIALLLMAAFFVRATCNPSDTGTTGNDTIVCDAANPPVTDIEGLEGSDVVYIDTGIVATGGVAGGTFVGAAPESGDDIIVNNGTVSAGIQGDANTGAGLGSDIIVNNGYVTGAVIGDSFTGLSSGSDTIINNGNVSASIYGDTGGPAAGGGDDFIVNNGTVADNIYGDVSLVDGSGDDTVINNGTADNIYGDSDTGNGSGHDVIVNNGSVNEIVGDNTSGTGTGDDTIINSGMVTNNIIAGGGSDTVIIQGNNGQVGGVMDGGAGYDVLTFNISTTNPDELRMWAEQIAAANPAGGTLTLAGHTYTWTNFEELTRLIFSVARLNPIADPVAVFCSLEGGVNTYAIVGPQGYFSLNVTAQQISNGITQAQASVTNVQLATSATSTLYALPSGEVQVNIPNGTSFRFRYQGFCGTLPAPREVEPIVEEEPPFSIINQPYGG